MASKQQLSNCKATLASERQRATEGSGAGEEGVGCLIFPVCYSSPSPDDVAELGHFVDIHSVIFAEHCDYYYRLFLSVSHSNGL